MKSKNNRSSRQTTIFSSIKEDYKNSAEKAVEKSMPEINKIIEEKDINSNDLVHAVLERSYSDAKKTTDKIQKSNNNKIRKGNNVYTVIYKEDFMIKEKIIKKLSDGIHMEKFPTLLLDYEMIFKDFLLSGLDETSLDKMIPKLVFDDNKNLIKRYQKNIGQTRKFGYYIRAGKIEAAARIQENMDYKTTMNNPFALLNDAINSDDIRDQTEKKIIKIGEILYSNGLPEYFAEINEDFDEKKFQAHLEKLRKKSDNGICEDIPLIRIDKKKWKEDPPATFRLEDYSESDTVEKVIPEIKKQMNNIKLLRGILIESYYKPSEFTKEVVKILEQKVLPHSDFVGEIGRRGHNYIVEVCSSKKALDIIDTISHDYDHLLKGNKKYHGPEKFRNFIIYDLVRAYDFEENRKNIEYRMAECNGNLDSLLRKHVLGPDYFMDKIKILGRKRNSSTVTVQERIPISKIIKKSSEGTITCYMK